MAATESSTANYTHTLSKGLHKWGTIIQCWVAAMHAIIALAPPHIVQNPPAFLVCSFAAHHAHNSTQLNLFPTIIIITRTHTLHVSALGPPFKLHLPV